MERKKGEKKRERNCGRYIINFIIELNKEKTQHTLEQNSQKFVCVCVCVFQVV